MNDVLQFEEDSKGEEGDKDSEDKKLLDAEVRKARKPKSFELIELDAGEDVAQFVKTNESLEVNAHFITCCWIYFMYFSLVR